MVYHPFRHLGLKVLSVAIAVALWFTVSGEQTVERSLRVPLELQNMPETLEIVDNPPASVDVRVRGASGVLSHLATGDIVAVVDLATARAGRKFFHLTREHVRVPFGVEVAQVSPGTISLMFEPQGQKPVPVVPVVEGDPAPGFVKGAVTARPSEVQVVGPQSTLRFLKEAVTEPVLIQGAKATVRETVTIGVNDTSLRLKTPASAEVTVEVLPSVVTRTITGVPIQFRGLRPKGTVEATPSAVSVEVRGPQALVSSLRPASLTAVVDLAGIRPGRYNLSIRVEPPPDIVVVSTDPPKTGVRIR
jgi:YbbR domain-containing protein